MKSALPLTADRVLIFYGMHNNSALMWWGLAATERVFVFMSLQDDYVRTWDENQGSNDSKLKSDSK